MAGALLGQRDTGNSIIRRNLGQLPSRAIRQWDFARNVEQYPQAGGAEMKYLIVYEKSNTG
jgi:hypothetical protein